MTIAVFMVGGTGCKATIYFKARGDRAFMKEAIDGLKSEFRFILRVLGF
jgi:hypothetical protein